MSGFDQQVALVVHRDMTMLSALQGAFARRGFAVIAARDLSTALLAITQHHFNAALVNANITESGDGFPLAGIIQRIFPEAPVCVLSVSVEVPDLLSAINSGVYKLIDVHSRDADSLVGSALTAVPQREV
ncbi:MAG: hypothetical protein L0Z53_00805 [Acidobacteriales bacterium]|nr:hypothetical protein [Terriglobales bacterium]